MELHKIKLENIRSYLNEEINFTKGSTLLAGDVGSGKSTILLAIDFALFGITKGVLSGSSLLRNGKNNGSVELHFKVDNKEVIIKRNLKRSSDTVMQDTGYIIINEKKQELSPIELKQNILDLLNYPKELLTKSKSLIYRYTVYTPQEEMKYILTEDKDLRLDTLRRVFNIDKYKKVRENSKIFITKVKEKTKEFEGIISDLEDLRKDTDDKEKDLISVESKIHKLLPDLNEIKKEILSKENKIKELEKNISELNSLKRKLDVNKTNLDNKSEQLHNYNEEILDLEKEIKLLKKEIEDKSFDLKYINKEIKDKENEIKFMEDTLKEINNKISEFKVEIEHSNSIKREISKLDICPICKQKVTKEHMKEVIEEENNKIEEFSRNLNLHEKEEKIANKKLDELIININKSREKIQEMELFNMKLENLKDKERILNKNITLKQKLKDDLENFKIEKDDLNKNLEEFKDAEKIYDKVKEDLNNLKNKEREIEIIKASFEQESKGLKNIISDLDKKIKSKLEFKDNLNYLKQINHWLENHFIKLINTIERRIMLKVYHDFNNLFEKWFNVLMEEENLVIKLDYEFSPLILQNGYEIDYFYLSGGEKTAAALAYRLALNQVINNLISTIKTKDLLILDEPTDGFSTDQLDRIRLVLNELNINQVIIVSHESKIESFVDNVIRINKVNHVSKVV